jgi:hypothetical protein
MLSLSTIIQKIKYDTMQKLISEAYLYQQHYSAYEGGNAAETKVHNQLPNPSNLSA